MTSNEHKQLFRDTAIKFVITNEGGSVCFYPVSSLEQASQLKAALKKKGIESLTPTFTPWK